MKQDQTGHHFLARMGKTRLRPGGKQATDWLIAQGQFNKRKKVLEVACNMATTAIELAQNYHCQIIGVDLDDNALQKARINIRQKGLSHLIEVQHGNATRLPFADNSFDIVVNEAMLTMLPNEVKQKAVAEYFRVLKPNGILLTHDVVIRGDDQSAVIDELRDTIKVNVTPLNLQDWLALFNDSGFQQVDYLTGDMSLLSPQGLIRDEGVEGAFKIMRNALKAENRPTFLKMFKTFNQPNNPMGFIAVASRK